MSEAAMEQTKAKAVALTNARLYTVLQQTRKDESRLKRILDLRRMKRRLRAVRPK
jgi:hypothetical protein